MKTISIFLIFLAILFSTACQKAAESSYTSSNREFKVDFLFENNGIKVYRFEDCGRPIYYTDARGEIQYETGGKSSMKIKTNNN